MNISMYTRYVSLIIIWKIDEQRRTASTEIYCCWKILMFSESFTLHHRIVIISYYIKHAMDFLYNVQYVWLAL